MILAWDDVLCIGIEVAHDLVVPGGLAETLQDFGVRARAIIRDGDWDEMGFDESGELGIG